MPTDQQLKKDLIALFKHKANALSWHHEVGRKVREMWGTEPYGKAVTESLANELGASKSYLQRAAQFAELYQAEEVEGLEPLTWMKMTVLFAVKEVGRRRRLIEQANNRNWTLARLEEEITKSIGPRPVKQRGSRKKHRTLGMAGDAYELLRRTTAWVRHVDQIWADPHKKISAQNESQARTLRELEDVLKQAKEHVANLRSRLLSYRQQSR